jgi:hypothetical protein
MDVEWMIAAQYFGRDPDRRFGGRWSLRGIVEHYTTDRVPPITLPEPTGLFIQLIAELADVGKTLSVDLEVIIPGEDGSSFLGSEVRVDDVFDLPVVRYTTVFPIHLIPFPKFGEYIFRAHVAHFPKAEMKFAVRSLRSN